MALKIQVILGKNKVQLEGEDGQRAALQGGHHPNQSTHQAEHSAKQQDRVLEDILTLIKASHLDQTQTSCIGTLIHVSG